MLTMDQDQFLAFKGLKQYTPEVGWESLGAQDSYAANAIEPARASSLGVQTSGPHAHQDFQAPQRHLTQAEPPRHHNATLHPTRVKTP